MGLPDLASKAAGFDAILAHHAEAALLARYALPGRPRPPVIYCAHTLLEQELPEYFKSSRSSVFSSRLDTSTGAGNAPGASGRASVESAAAAQPGSSGSHPIRGMTQRAIARFGRVIDRRIAASCDGWIALTQSSARVMRASSDAPGRLIAPPVPATHDAERGQSSSPSPARDPRHDAAAIARSHGLQPGRYFLYAGNLDPYQALPLLEAVAQRRCGAAGDERDGRGVREDGRQEWIPEDGPPPRPLLPIVIATHDERAPAFAARIGRAGLRGLIVCRVRSAGEAAALLAGARASIVPRRSLGGFPIKLANSLAAGIPVVALHGAEWGLVDGREALIGDPADRVGSLARALDRLELDPALAARLGEGARATHRRQHDPARVAAETLALVAELAERSKRRD
ncbi:MAG: glycosyltransferase [Myxococcota bacterium]